LLAKGHHRYVNCWRHFAPRRNRYVTWEQTSFASFDRCSRVQANSNDRHYTEDGRAVRADSLQCHNVAFISAVGSREPTEQCDEEATNHVKSSEIMRLFETKTCGGCDDQLKILRACEIHCIAKHSEQILSWWPSTFHSSKTTF
jgi:hypothetical protein